MPRARFTLLACGLLAAGSLQAQSSDYPLALNLPTSDQMQFWDLGVGFTHRFVTPAKDHGKDAYGLDGLAYAGLGLDFGIKPIPGLNVLLYRTADNKTFVFALQQRVVDHDWIRMSARAERFDEVIPAAQTTLGDVGITGTAFQLPTEFFLGDHVIVSLVPTYLSRTTTQRSGVFNVGVGVHISFTEKFGFMGEYYPTPSKVKKPGTDLNAGFAAGFTYKTFKHRFTLLATNSTGTTANQVLSGDYGGGARSSSQWSLGFNIARVF
ncbi:MAG TPA: DUF5777 family beta-barrel protein [Holophagaceae bacterium]|nr:DUF5777 family beta-barrel protein [Holophagaceae bacterium]